MADTRNPVAGGDRAVRKMSCVLADAFEHTPDHPPFQPLGVVAAPIAIPSAAAQCREHIAELAGVIGANAEIVARYAELGDDVGLEYQLRRLILHVRAMTATFKDLAEIENARRAESEAA